MPQLRTEEGPPGHGPVSLLSLFDGRSLAFSEYGDPCGFPLIYFHNHASSRHEAQFYHSEALRSGFRIISVDRPGIGRSDSRRGMRHRDFAEDVIALADALQLPDFGLLCWAGGAAFAFATAHHAADRVRMLISIAPVPLRQSRQAGSGSFADSVSRLSFRATRSFIGLRHLISTQNPQRYLSRLGDELCFADRKLLRNPRVVEVMIRGIEASRRQGGRCLASDTSLCFDRWDFAVEELKVPVHLWHGTADTVIPAHCSQALAGRLSNCVLRRASNRGHFFFMQGASEVFALANTELCRMNSALGAVMPAMHTSVSAAGPAGATGGKSKPQRPVTERPGVERPGIESPSPARQAWG